VSDATTGFTWVALGAAVVGMLIAGWRLRRGITSATGRNGWLAALLFGLVVLLNTVPRLAGAPSGVILVLSTIALLPLVGFVVLTASIARPGQR
jgi:hypothetical protein